jgi:hypothetical protein
VLAAMLLLATTGAATAAPSGNASAQPAAGIEISIAAPAPLAAASVREDLQDLLARRGVDARYRRLDAVDRDEVLRPAAQSPCSLACIWIDLGVASPGRAFVYISATASEQVVIRSLPLPSGVDEVAREEVSHIVATSVEALQAGRPLTAAVGRPDDAVVAKAEPAPPPPPPAAGAWVEAGLGAGAARESADHLALPTIGLSLLVGSESARLAPALWLQAAGFSSDASGEAVALRFRGGELAALGAIATSPHGRAVARLGLGAGLELRSTTPSLADGAAAGGLSLASSQLDPTVFVRAAARFEVRLSGRVGLFSTVACDARVMSHRYTIANGGMTESVYQPDRLRPSVVVGVGALLAGGAP